MDSGYPTKLVVNTASPLTLALAPKLFPWKIGPSRIVKVARSKDGLVIRGEVGGGDACVEPLTAVARPRIWITGLKALEVKLLAAADWKVAGLKALVKINAAIYVVDRCYFWPDWHELINVGLPEVVGDVVCGVDACQPGLRRAQSLIAMVEAGWASKRSGEMPYHTLRSEDSGSKSHRPGSGGLHPERVGSRSMVWRKDEVGKVKAGG